MAHEWTTEQRVKDDWALTAEEFDCDACGQDYHVDLLGFQGLYLPDDVLGTMLCINCARLTAEFELGVQAGYMAVAERIRSERA